MKQAKRLYRIKIESYYTSSDACQMWQGLKTITDYKGKPSRELPSDASLPDKLNYFYNRLTSVAMKCFERLVAPGGKGRQQHVSHADPQHRRPSGVRA
jgi:hypothetical protein